MVECLFDFQRAIAADEMCHRQYCNSFHHHCTQPSVPYLTQLILPFSTHLCSQLFRSLQMPNKQNMSFELLLRTQCHGLACEDIFFEDDCKKLIIVKIAKTHQSTLSGMTVDFDAKSVSFAKLKCFHMFPALTFCFFDSLLTDSYSSWISYDFIVRIS